MPRNIVNYLLLVSLLLTGANTYGQDSNPDTPVSDSGQALNAPTSSTAEKINWADLSYEERQILQQLESRWDELSPDRQRRLQRGANRWQQMQPQERAEAQEQQQRFREMPVRQKQLINQRFQRFNSLNRQEQVRLRTIQRRFQNLSPEQRRRLREQFQEQAAQREPLSRTDTPDSDTTDDTQQRIQDVIRQNRDVLRPITRPNNTQQQRPGVLIQPRISIPN